MVATKTAALPAGLDSNLAPEKEQMVRIILEESDKIPPTGQFFGINGKGYMLRAGEVALVPRGIIDILDNAVESAPVMQGGTGKIIGYRKRHRFPYRRVSESEAALNG
jgi:hypothetical protein